MVTALVCIGLIAVLLHGYREYWARRSLPRTIASVSGAEVFQAGATDIAVLRPPSPPERTVVCIPGFLETSTYFLDLYADRGFELILVNNADYHSPFPTESAKPLAWGPNPFPIGTIEHDAFYLGHAVRELATTRDIVLHGHSRGGAVVLDAARQFPTVMRDPGRRIQALLEASVVPQGTPAGGFPGPLRAAVTTYLLPIAFGLLRNLSPANMSRMPMMNPSNERKTRVLASLFANPKHFATCVVNLRNIWDWQRRHGHELYEGYADVRLFVGERDDVLDTETMRASGVEGARRNPGVRVVDTKGTNHFITLEHPDAIHAALGEAHPTGPPS